MALQPSIGPVDNGCLNCPPKPETAPMDWYPHPGFGMLDLTRDGETPEAWATYPCLEQTVTLGDIEEAVADDPDHDWRLEIHGPLGGVIYQRHGAGVWHLIERLDGFA